MTIYMLHFPGVEHSREELPVATNVMQNITKEFSFPGAVKGKCNQRKNNKYA